MSDPYTRYCQGEAVLAIRREWCKGCDICIDACPVDILKLDETNKVFATDISSCIFCGICAERCPDFCFFLERPDTEAPFNKNTIQYETDSR